MLREDVDRYTKLTREDGWHVPISTIGAYLDGYNKGLEVLDKIRAEIEKIPTAPFATAYTAKSEALEIIDKYKSESEEE